MTKESTPIREAEEALVRQEYYRARKLTAAVLEADPRNDEAQRLMAEILDQEISGQKAVLDPQVLEELDPKEKSAEAKTWLERAEALQEMNHHEEALAAAEKVFLYDPDNTRASELIDRILKSIYRQGKNDVAVLKQMHEQESRQRVRVYLQRSRRFIEEGQWSAAKLTLEKAMMLAPGDKEALSLYESVQAHRKVDPQ